MFRKLSWTAQLLAGVTLFGISLLLEALVLSHYLGITELAFFLAAALEASKALTVILYRVMKTQPVVRYPISVQAAVLVFRVGLLGLSAACSVMYLADRLDRPFLNEVRTADQAHIEANLAAQLDRMERAYTRDRAERISVLEAQRKVAEQTLVERSGATIRELEHLLTQEMDNVVGGNFEGPRYRALQVRLREEKAAFNQRLGALQQKFNERRNLNLERLDAPHRDNMAKARAAAERRLTRLNAADYADDERVQNAMVRAFLSVTNEVMHTDLGALHFVFFFSLFLSVLIELGIVVAFENLTLAQLPIFALEEVTSRKLKEQLIQTQEALRGLDIDDDFLREKLKRKRQHIEEALDEAVDAA